MNEKIFICVDMDAFFASIEVSYNPSLKGKPIVIGGPSKKRGVVACASYEARKYGITAGMPIFKAVKLYSDIIVIDPNFKRYAQTSKIIFHILNSYSPVVDIASIDEAYIDITGCERLLGSPIVIGQKIKDEIKKKLKIACSVGIGPTKYIAKMASNMSKPNGLYEIKKEMFSDIFAKTPVEKVSGIGQKMKLLLNRMDIYTISDINKYTLPFLKERLGKFGSWLYKIGNGQEIGRDFEQKVVKSIGMERTFDKNVLSIKQIRHYILDFSAIICFGMRQKKLLAKTVQLKLRYSNFATVIHSKKIETPTNFTLPIYKNMITLLNKMDLKDKKVRLIGTTVMDLIPDTRIQAHLFNYHSFGQGEKLYLALDKIWEKYNNKVIKFGSTRKL